MNCPGCGSIRIVSNKIHTVPFDRFASGVRAMHASGHTAFAAGTTLSWFISKAINAMSHDWQCTECGREFT